MSREAKLTFDEIGYWSEIKLDIINAYAQEYSKIISSQTGPSLYHVYIDAFAGAGMHISKTTKKQIPGSPLNALAVNPPFKKYYFIDLDSSKVDYLKQTVGNNPDVIIREGDCNSVLLNEIFPNVQYKQYRRGLCLLDPYGLHLKWDVIKAAADLGTVEIFLNFPISDMNRNVFWHDPEGVDPADLERMTAFWGDASWRDVAYTTKKNLFGHLEKEPNAVIAESFGARLRDVAGFKYVSKPLPMKNTNNATLYHLFFASQKPVAKKIVDHIFDKYSKRGVR